MIDKTNREAEEAYKRIRALLNAHKFSLDQLSYTVRLLIMDIITSIDDDRERRRFVDDFFNSALDNAKFAIETLEKESG